jgi:hypothetical protein
VFSSLLCERRAKPCARFWHQLLSLMLAPALGPAPYSSTASRARRDEPTAPEGKTGFWHTVQLSRSRDDPPPRRARVRDTVERNRHSRGRPPPSQDRASHASGPPPRPPTV